MNKRIYKNREKKMLCGVCAGLAEYFDIDPTLVRVLWAVISLGYGIGLLAYNSISTRDQPQIQAIIVYVAMVYIVINIILDILYKYFDPRIQLD